MYCSGGDAWYKSSRPTKNGAGKLYMLNTGRNKGKVKEVVGETVNNIGRTIGSRRSRPGMRFCNSAAA